MVNILMLSKWHVHAKDYAKTISEQPDARITCVWDEDAARGAAWAKELGVPFEPDLEKALAREDVDAVVVDTPTTMHRKVMVKAARARMSADDAPTMTWISPDWIRQRPPSPFQNATWAGVRRKRMRLASPGPKATRRKPRNSCTGRETAATGSRT